MLVAGETWYFLARTSFKIDVESMVSCYTQCIARFVAFPFVSEPQAYHFVPQIALLVSRLDWYHGS